MITEGRGLRDAHADAVHQGYLEAMVVTHSVRMVGGGMPHRPWSDTPAPKGLSGAALESVVDQLALRFPGYVSAEV